MEISDEHKRNIKDIIENEDKLEVLSHKLKLYFLENREYFDGLISSMDVAWLVKTIILSIKKRV